MAFKDKLDLNFINEKFEADAFFPEIDPAVWKETDRHDFCADEKTTTIIVL